MTIKNMPKIIALLPMRHHSERIPGKNYRTFAGKPLYYHIVENLRACPYISEICIDTDSPFIVSDAKAHFPVRLIDRPEHLRGDKEPMNSIILYDVTQSEADFYLQTHSTNPLLTTKTISSAIETFLEPGDHDSLFGVSRLQTRLYDRQGHSLNHDPDVLLRTQDLEPVYEENSTLYIFSRDVLEKKKNRIGYRPLLFEVDREEAIDIDEELDFVFAEFLYLQRAKGGR
jgi:CMP-N-acetylneuraminic acid synthetase